MEFTVLRNPLILIAFQIFSDWPAGDQTLRRRSCRSQSGFTLIEILVSLVILGLSLGIILGGLDIGVDDTQNADQSTISILIAKSLLATQDAESVRKVGEQSGITGDHYVWKITTRPWPVGSNSDNHLISAYYVQIVVVHAGRPVTLTTILAGPTRIAN